MLCADARAPTRESTNWPEEPLTSDERQLSEFEDYGALRYVLRRRASISRKRKKQANRGDFGRRGAPAQLVLALPEGGRGGTGCETVQSAGTASLLSHNANLTRMNDLTAPKVLASSSHVPPLYPHFSLSPPPDLSVSEPCSGSCPSLGASRIPRHPCSPFDLPVFPGCLTAYISDAVAVAAAAASTTRRLEEGNSDVAAAATTILFFTATAASAVTSPSITAAAAFTDGVTSPAPGAVPSIVCRSRHPARCARRPPVGRSSRPS